MENENLLPKNIRQIGEIQGRQKICLEDYVVTYIRKMEKRGNENYLGVLLGEQKSTDDADYVFVRGIMEVPDFSQRKEDAAADNTGEKKEEERQGLWQAFQKRYGTQEDLQNAGKAESKESNSKDNAADKRKNAPKDSPKEEGGESSGNASEASSDPWMEWKQEQERRFPGWKIQGCCVIGTYPSGRLEELSAHLSEAARMLYHLQDQEERLYWQVGEQYEGVKGYFVFYEQNQQMQEYLAETFGNGSVEKEGGSDRAIISFREKVKNKAEEKSQSFLRLASSFFVVGVLIVGVIVVNRVSDTREAQNVSETAQVSSGLENWSQSENPTDAKSIETEEEAEDGVVSVSGESALAGADAFWADEEDDAAAEEAAAAVTGSSADGGGTTGSEEDGTAGSEEGGAESGENRVTVSSTGASTDSDDAGDTSGDTVSSEAAAATTETVSRQIQAAYVIREGDTLAEICARYYGSTERLEELCEANGIEDANLIIPGQKIVLP